MAKNPARTAIDQSVVDYLESKYPGITRDCLGYQHVSRSNGEDTLTVNLLIDKSVGQD